MALVEGALWLFQVDADVSGAYPSANGDRRAPGSGKQTREQEHRGPEAAGGPEALPGDSKAMITFPSPSDTPAR